MGQHPEGHHGPSSKEECLSLNLRIHPPRIWCLPGFWVSQPLWLCASVCLCLLCPLPPALFSLGVSLCVPFPPGWHGGPSSGPGCGADFLIPGSASNQNFQFLLDKRIPCRSQARVRPPQGTSGCLHLHTQNQTTALHLSHVPDVFLWPWSSP